MPTLIEYQEDNWTILNREYGELFGMVYQNMRTYESFRFLGLLTGDDDYYYALNSIDGDSGLVLASCVGSLEGFGYRLVREFVETYCPHCGPDMLTLNTVSERYGPKELMVEDIEGYDCSKCLNTHYTPQQQRVKHDKILAAYTKAKLSE